MKFISFLRTVGFTATPAQEVLCRVAFDGEEPGSLTGTDRDLATQLFGPDVDTVPPEARSVIVIVKGARIGGSRMSALRALHLAATFDPTAVAPGEIASATIVGPDIRLGRQTLRFAHGAATATPALAGAMGSVTEDSFQLVTGPGRAVAVECLPATSGGRAVRGRSLVAAVMSEAAFFRDRDYLVNDEEISRALAPRLTHGAQLIIESTPYAEMGLLHSLYHENWNSPETALAVRAPTLLMRPEPTMRALVERERKRDPDNAAREFDAEFISAGSDLFFDPTAIDRCAALEVPE